MKYTFAFILSIILIAFSPAPSEDEHQFIGEKKLYYGASYYPETWSMEEVDRDIRYMKELKMNVMRMAEFSWSKMEPEEGKYDFAWLHEIVEKLHKNGISVVLGTPTATPPAWMWEKYPDIARVNDEGLKTIHGARRSTSFTSPSYLKKSRQIVEKMAEEFGNKPGVIGWQIDNELHASPDYSKASEKLWHSWLEKKYSSIDKLNQLWATDLWSQTYQKFEQIPMPLSRMWHHPSLQLDWHKFNEQNLFDFQNMQIAIIRKHSKLPITHDTMPGQATDYYKMMEDADYMAVNNYHSFEAYDRIISNYDRMRGYRKGYHWLFETAPNNSGGGKKGQTWFLHQPDGSMFAALWMNYALGGQGMMFWLWRQHRAGHEMPHGSILHSWGKPAANFEQLKQMGEQLEKSSDFLMNAPVTQAKMAIMYSHESEFGLRVEQYANGIRYYTDWSYHFYLPFQDAYLHRDVISPEQAIDRYKVLFVPLLPYMPQETRDRLKKWVNDGGTAIIGPMTGYRTEHWAAFTEHAQGDLATWTGIEVNSRIPVGTKRRPAEIPLMLDYQPPLSWEKSEASLWSEALSSEKGEVIATYQSGMHDELPAIIENKVGKGKVVMLGTDPGRKAVAELLKHYANENGIKPIASGDKGVVVAPREGSGASGYVVVNIENKAKTIQLSADGRFKDILSEIESGTELKLSPYEVRVLKAE